MVSKIVKKNANRRRNRGKSSAKKEAVAASSAMLASLFDCPRRLVKLFAKLARIGTPNRHRGFKILKKAQVHEAETESEPGSGNPLCRKLLFEPPLTPLLSPEKMTVFLDLDETLVHAQADPLPEKFDFIVRPRIDGIEMNFYVRKRPGVDELLEKLGAKYEVVVFTAGLREYASLVLDRLDQKRVISHRLYRDACKVVDGKFVKDLSGLGRDLSRVVIVDDNPNSYVFQPDNAVPVRPFVDDMEDRELGRLVEFFEALDCEDMRDAVKKFLASTGGRDCGGSKDGRSSVNVVWLNGIHFPSSLFC